MSRILRSYTALTLCALSIMACAERADGPSDGGTSAAGTGGAGGRNTPPPNHGLDGAIPCYEGIPDDPEFPGMQCPDARVDETPPVTPLDAQVDGNDEESSDASSGCGDVCLTAPALGPLTPALAWSRMDFGVDMNEVAMQPIVTMLDDDNGNGVIDENDTPDLVFVASGEDNNPYIIGLEGNNSGYVFRTRLNGLLYATGLAAGDIDGDGFVEIIASTGLSLIALDHTGAEIWSTVEEGVAGYMGSPPTIYIADMENDGDPEIVSGRALIRSDGSLRHTFRYEPVPDPYGPPDSLPIDLDGDGTMELVTGAAAYDVDGTLRWSRNSLQGYPAAGNFDADDDPELVFVWGNTISLLESDGSELWTETIDDGAVTGGMAGGSPIVADFDGDTRPEIALASLTHVSMFDADGTRLWQTPIVDNSGFTGVIAFDFDADGSAEVVHAGTTTLSILSGIDGHVRFSAPRESMTGNGSATVADLDGDGAAELIVPWDGWSSSRGGIDVYEGPNWPYAAKGWSQHDYTIGNASITGAIPRVEERFWLTHNTFRAAGLPQNDAVREPCGCAQ